MLTLNFMMMLRYCLFCSQRMYLLTQLESQGLGTTHSRVVFLALIASCIPVS